MLISIVKARDVAKALPLVVEKHQRKVHLGLMFHRGLMVFFLVGYLGVIAAFLFKIRLIGEAFVSIIFLFGSLFVLVGIFIETRIIYEVRSTMNKILPICMNCMSIRIEGGNPDNQVDWKRMEDYFHTLTKVNFSHSLCPKCLLKMTKE